MRVVGRVLGFWRKHRSRKLAPPGSPVPAPQLRAEMAEIERGVNRVACRIPCPTALGQHRADRIAEKVYIHNLPTGAAARQFEQPLARPDIKPLRHSLPLNRPSGP